MSDSSLSAILPALYEGLLPAFFDSPVPEERNATCAQCAMCPPKDEPAPRGAFFSPDSKCCTFHPNLPNYSVGALLASDDPAGAEGRARIRAKIAARTGVHPHGIAAPPKYDVLFGHGRGTFGRTSSLLCPYFEREGGTCTIWRFREAVCSTYFCKHNAGADGQAFWQTLKHYLNYVQRCLIDHVLYELGFEVRDLAATVPSVLAGDMDSSGQRLAPNDLDDAAPSDAAFAPRWGEWAGREEAFYRRAHEIVAALDRAAFERLCGIGGVVWTQQLAARYRQMVEPLLPEVLQRNPELRVDRDAQGRYVLAGYSPHDMLRVRKDVYDLLDEFDGRRPTAQVLAEVAATRDLTVSDALLARLFQHRALVGARRVAPSEVASRE